MTSEGDSQWQPTPEKWPGVKAMESQVFRRLGNEELGMRGRVWRPEYYSDLYRSLLYVLP